MLCPAHMLVMLLHSWFYCVFSSRMGDVDDLPDIRVDASSPGPRVTFNIQDTVNLKTCFLLNIAFRLLQYVPHLQSCADVSRLCLVVSHFILAVLISSSCPPFLYGCMTVCVSEWTMLLQAGDRTLCSEDIFVCFWLNSSLITLLFNLSLIIRPRILQMQLSVQEKYSRYMVQKVKFNK